LAAVVAHSAWTSRKNAPRQAEPDDDQPTQPGEPREPQLHDSGLAADAATDMHIPAPKKELALDALIDAVAPIALEGPVSGDAAIAALPPTRRAGSKPVGIEGQNVRTSQWEPPMPGQRYGAFQAGVQLANRSGAMNEIEFSEFVMKVQAFCDQINGAPEFPEMLDEVARARELDQFASTHDAQLGFTLRARHAAWSPGYVQQNAARLGFVPGVIPGRMVLPASVTGLPPVLGLSFDSAAALAEDPAQSAIRELSLSLDVAQVARSEQPFVRMRETALALAATMEGLITDDHGNQLMADTLDQIGSELESLYDTLEARELAAGSPLARRLFS
jgi:hypothetical protein